GCRRGHPGALPQLRPDLPPSVLQGEKRISATISDAFQPPIHRPLLLQSACKTRGPFAKKKKKKKNTAWKSLHRVPTKPKLSEWILWFVFTLTDFSLWSCASRSAAERFKGKVLRL
ncbi:unnamed protein product, partial [Rangifer tarandus platyrhynchus]